MVSDAASRGKAGVKRDLVSTVLSLDRSQLVEVLSLLAKQDRECAVRLHELTVQVLRQVQDTDVAKTVYRDLCLLSEDDYYEQANRFNGGSYVDPYDLPYEMMEKELAPHTQRIQEFRFGKLFHEETAYVIGVLTGLYQYDSDSSRWFSDYVEECPFSIATQIYASWMSFHTDEASRSSFSTRVRELCPDWDFLH